MSNTTWDLREGRDEQGTSQHHVFYCFRMSAASDSQPLSEEKKHEFKPVEEVEGMDSSEEWKLNPEDIVNRCHVCQATENLMRCSACKAVYYCSKQHQVSVIIIIIDYEVRERERDCSYH